MSEADFSHTGRFDTGAQDGLSATELEYIGDLSARLHDALEDAAPGNPLPADGPVLLPADPPPEAAPAAARGADDDQANQRWLAGRGMLQLKDFVAHHGPNESAWQDEAGIDKSPVTEYVDRLRRLRGRQSRDFILNYTLKQGAGAEAAALIKRQLEGSQ